jgi:two-component system LytT family response regulator
MTAARTIIADDEAPARRRVRELLRPKMGYRVVAECETGAETVRAIIAERADVLFLDVRMPELDGLAALRELPERARPIVVLTTAYDSYAIEAFDLRAVDYLLKPYTDERFDEALDRVGRLLRGDRLAEWASRRPAVSDPPIGAPTAEHEGIAPGARANSAAGHVAVRHRGVVAIVPMADIDWVEASGDYVKLHVGAKVYPLRSTLGAVQHRLDPVRFVRVHRSCLVQLDRVRELQPFYRGDYVVVLRDGTRLRLSRSCRADVERALGLPASES